MKKLFMLMSVLVLGLVLAGCQTKERPTLNFDQKSVVVEEGSFYTLTPVITNVENTVAVLYQSNDESIAKVVDNKILGVAHGQTVIIATLEGYRLTSVSINVTVTAKPAITVEKVEIIGAKDLKLQEEVSLTATVTTNGEDKGVTWTTSDATVATVDANGKVTALNVGTVDITATSTFDTGKSAKVTINVTRQDPESIIINGAKGLIMGETVTLSAIVSPDLAIQEVTWSSSDENVLSVNADGVVTAKNPGTATVTATSVVLPTVTKTVEITVSRPAATGLVISGSNIAKVEEAIQLTAAVTPAEALPELIWTSGDETIATVDANGKVTALKAGTVTISVKVKDLDAVNATYEVSFTPSDATDIQITGNANAITGDVVNLSASVLPATAAQKVIWSSSDETIATVDANGKVTTLKAGTVTITAKVEGFETVSKELVITISDPVAKIGSTKYASFTEAVNAVAEGETIVVLAGNYSDNVTISKDNVTILGPNQNVNPNTRARLAEAIFTGKWVVASGVDNLVINGLAFTGTAWIDGDGAITNLAFKNNYVYDTVEATSTWTASRADVKGFMTFWNAPQYGFKGLTVENNKFANVNEVNISLARVADITIKNNTFTNFDRDAIRLDGGYNIGYFNVEGNTFANDTLGGYNGLFFRSYGGASTDGTIEVNINFNRFKNIGQANTTFSGAFSTNSYQEYSALIHVDYNTFENCTNYIHLRNNGIKQALGYTWEAYANYNKFIGEPLVYYCRNLNGSTDTTTSNPALLNFNYNFFIDNNGNPVTDVSTITSKVMDTASFANSFTTDEAYNQAVKAATIGSVDAYVSADWATMTNGDTVEVDGASLILGQTAFASLDAALAACDDEALIYVLPGTYAGNVTISRSNVTVITNNRDVDPNLEPRTAEAVFTGTVSLAKGVSNIIFNGLAFTAGGYVTAPEGGIDGFTFIYNNFFDSAVPAGNTGLLYFKDVTGKLLYEQVNNLVVTNNYFKALNNPRLINMQLAGNLFIKNNYFETANTTYTDGVRLDKLVATTPVVIEGNEFVNIYQYALMVSNYDAPEFRVIGNKFTNIVTGAISIRTYVGDATTTAQDLVNVTYNSFINVKGTAIRVDHLGTFDTEVLDINVNYNIFNDTLPTVYFSNSKAGVAANLDNNYYAGNAAEAAKLVGAASYENTYTNLADVPTYRTSDETYPETVTITNKISELERFAEYQLEFVVSPNVATNKKVLFVSNDTNIATVNATGLITAKAAGTVTITVKCAADESVLDTFVINVNEPARIEAEYEGNGALQVGESVVLSATVIPTAADIIWTSTNPEIATVDEAGIIRAVGVGNVFIVGKLANDENVTTEIGFTVFGDEVTDDLLKLLIEANSGVVLAQNVAYIGSDDGSKDYDHLVYGGVSNYFNSTINVVRNMIPTTSNGYSGVNMTSIEFITIHDTANTSTGSGALANSNWCNNPTNTSGASWHYTVGNDGVYQQVEDEMKAFHAGDGSRSFGLNDTGIFATTPDPVLTISADGYYELNGLKTTVVAPTNSGTILTTADIVATGIYVTIGENGNYFINNTWYNTGFGGNIVNNGGNNNSIGIESAVNNDSDVYLTWQRLAKLAASLLIKHNLGTDRMLAHNNFSGKPCPRTMLTAGLWDNFKGLVETEYQIQKNYSDYTITFESLNPEIVDNSGRIVHAPGYTTNVQYKVTVTKGEFSQSIVLNALVKGIANW